MKKWLMNLSKSSRYFVVLLPLIIFAVFIIIFAVTDSPVMLVLAITSFGIGIAFLYFNGQVEQQIKKDKEKAASEEQAKQAALEKKEFDGYYYSIDETNGVVGHNSIIRAIYWKDGEYYFLNPKIITLNNNGETFDVLINNKKIGEINDKPYLDIKNNYSRIALTDLKIEHEKEYGNNEYTPWLKVLYCTEKRLKQFPNFKYVPRGQRISEFRKPSFLDEYVVIDTETTDIDPEKGDIIEVSAIRIKDSKPISQFSEKIYSEKITAESTSINHITFSDVAKARQRNDVLNDFVTFIGNLPVIGHNVNFDLSFICTSHPVGNQFDDTCLFAEEFLKTGELGIKIQNSKLSTVCDALGVDLKNAHSSLGDCYATYQCYEKLKELLYKSL